MNSKLGNHAAISLAALGVLALAACSDGGDDSFAAKACEVTTDAGTVVVGSGNPGDPSLPEPSSGYKVGMKAVTSRSYMVVSANPLATRAGCNVLKDGGSAVDAAVAVQAVLGLVEPQSSGVGGGTFMMHYDAGTKQVQAYDGRETAPAAATEDYLRYVTDAASGSPLPNARSSGRSIGTPGTVRMLELAHNDHGRKQWSSLYAPAIDLANNGFKISGRLADAIGGAASNLQRDPEASAYFLNADGTPKALGTTLKNPDYANTLGLIAQGGANAFYTGPVAQSIIDKINVTTSANGAGPITPGLTTLTDLANYQPKRREPVCSGYRSWTVCGMPPPSSGGIAVAQILGILENFQLAPLAPIPIDGEGGKPTVQGVHLISEAERLAYADRNAYVADTDFVPLPGNGIPSLLDKGYLKQRASMISLTQSIGTAQPGTFPNAQPVGLSIGLERGTSHVSIVDRYGNVVSMTTTVESSLGSYHFTRGFILNNELTDFSSAPSDATGPIANRVAANKRPRSSMAPTLVFKNNTAGARGDFLMATGSPGGSTIIQFVAKTVVGALDWGLDAQQATSLVNFGSANGPTTNVGGEHPDVDASNNGINDPLVVGLRALGHTVNTASQSSGVGTIIRTSTEGAASLTGGADPRREGIVLGDVIR
ncbi:MAG: gamma-glutamyltransferase [Burkholderiales bacterium]